MTFLKWTFKRTSEYDKDQKEIKTKQKFKYSYNRTKLNRKLDKLIRPSGPLCYLVWFTL